MEYITYKGTTLGLKIVTLPNGSIPQTADNESLQLVTLKHPKDTILVAHMHKPRKRVTPRLQEGIVVLKGRIRIGLYSDDKEFVKYIYLNAGQIYIAMSGGIELKMLADSEILEFKNGPFKEDKVVIEK